jgi:hypothetical protein
MPQRITRARRRRDRGGPMLRLLVTFSLIGLARFALKLTVARRE